MPYAKTPDGVHLAYQVEGDGPPLLLLAGQANTHRWWSGVRDDFHATHQTITLDWRGTGASDKPDAPYSTEQFAEDALSVLDAEGIDRAAVYGTSMGGRVAQHLAARHPARVRALILGCTTPGGPHAVERDQSVRRSLATADPGASIKALLELMYTPEWIAAHRGSYTTLGDLRMPAHARRHHLAASNRHDAWDLLPRITAPTLVVHGADDRFNPAANAPLLAERIPGAALHLVPRARHAYFDEFRETASPLVRDFLAAAG